MKLILSIMVIVASSTMAMDVNKLLRDVKKEFTKDIQEADTITLISKEGQKFTLLNDVAKQSETIKSMMQDVLDDKRELPLQNISSVTLGEIAQLLHQLYLSRDIQNEKKLLDALEEKVKITDPFLLLAAANYLDIPPILNFAARAVARDEFKQSSFLKKSGLNKKIAALFGTSSKDIMSLIAHYYFLLSSKKLKGVSEDSYGFSVQDYLDYEGSLPEEYHIKLKRDMRLRWGDKERDWMRGIVLDLRNRQLRSLNGLQNIENKRYVDFLTLSGNQLTEISADDLKDFEGLIRLDLYENKLKIVPFPRLDHIKMIALNDNLLSGVPLSLGPLTTLKWLSIWNNPIKNVNPGVFLGKNSLVLYISRKQLLPEAIKAIKAYEQSIKIVEDRLWGLFGQKEY